MIAAILLQITVALGAPQPLDTERMLSAIVQTENATRYTVGAAGETGIYQITPQVWRKYSKLPQWSAPLAEQKRVALSHVSWLRAQLKRHNLPDTPRMVAYAYTAGITAVVRRTASAAKWEYAERAANNYAALP